MLRFKVFLLVNGQIDPQEEKKVLRMDTAAENTGSRWVLWCVLFDQVGHYCALGCIICALTLYVKWIKLCCVYCICAVCLFCLWAAFWMQQTLKKSFLISSQWGSSLSIKQDKCTDQSAFLLASIFKGQILPILCLLYENTAGWRQSL